MRVFTWHYLANGPSAFVPRAAVEASFWQAQASQSTCLDSGVSARPRLRSVPQPGSTERQLGATSDAAWKTRNRSDFASAGLEPSPSPGAASAGPARVLVARPTSSDHADPRRADLTQVVPVVKPSAKAKTATAAMPSTAAPVTATEVPTAMVEKSRAPAAIPSPMAKNQPTATPGAALPRAVPLSAAPPPQAAP